MASAFINAPFALSACASETERHLNEFRDQYCGPAPVPAELMWRWNLDPVLIGIVVAVCVAHLFALQRASEWPNKRWPFLAAWVLLFALFVSPLCALSSALFSVRAAHHIVLVAIVAPLAVIALPSSWRVVQVSASLFTSIVAVHAIVLWMWHEPSVYALALSDRVSFWIMQLSLLGTALIVWLLALSPATTLLSSVVALLTTMMQMGLLGAIITFAPRPLYSPHFASTQPFGLGALEDQQLAGMTMWVPAALPYLAASLMLLVLHVQRVALASGKP